MSGVLIGVGGSGQHVVHAYLRMMVLGNVPATEVPHVFVVDADADINEREGNASLCQNISHLHTQLIGSLRDEHKPKFGIIRPYFQHHLEDCNPGSSLLHMGGDDRDVLVNAFLTDDMPRDGTADANDRTIDINQGMMANAKVGAFVFLHKLEQCNGNPESTVTNFGTLMGCIQDQRIAIIGSSFGGTGSGVIPAFVRYLDALPQGMGAPQSVRAFMMLPWFDIKPMQGGARRSSAATTSDGIDPQVRNSALGLRNYLSELSSETLFRSNYVIAQYTGRIAVREDRGNFRQPEIPHVFNSVVATTVRHYLTGDDLAENVENSLQRVLFGLRCSDQREVTGHFDPRRSNHLRFRIGQDDNRQLYDLMLDTEVAALALEKGAEFINSGFKVEHAEKQAEPKELSSLCLHIGKHDGSKIVQRGFPLFRREEGNPEVYTKLADELTRIANRMRSSLAWLDRQKSTGDIPGLEIEPKLLHLFDTVENGNFRKLSETELETRWGAYNLDVRRRSGDEETTLNRASKSSQAFGLFLNCFQGRSLVSQLTDLAGRNQGVSLYVLAAQLLASAAYAEASRARASQIEAQTRTNVGDISVTALNRCLLKADIPGIIQDNMRNANCRVAQLDKSALETTTEGGDVADFVSDPMLPEHPVSLSQIDPLLGMLNNTELNKLRKGEVGFKENGLKGVPSLLAPILLQHWRLRQFSNLPTPTNFALWTAQSGQPIRSTRWGMYYLARSVIEAALWMLFKDDARVELKSLASYRNATESTFAASLKSEMRKLYSEFDRTGTSPLPDTVIAFSSNSGSDAGKPVFMSDPECGWVLAANVAARSLFAVMLPEIPTAKYSLAVRSTDAAEDHWSTQPHSVTPGSLDLSLIHMFERYIGEIVSDIHYNTLLKLALISIRSDLEAILKSKNVQPGAGTMPVNWATPIAPGLQVFKRAEGRRPERIQLKKAHVCSELRNSDIFVRQPYVFHYGKANGSITPRNVWPVLGRAWEKFELPDPADLNGLFRVSEIEPESNSTRGRYRIDSLQLKLKGLGSIEFKQEDIGGGAEAGGAVSLEMPSTDLEFGPALWPNFAADDWNYYVANAFVAAFDSLKDFDGDGNYLPGHDKTEVSFVFYGEPANGGPYSELGTCKYHIPVKLSGRPRCVEIRVAGTPIGSIPIVLQQIDASAPQSHSLHRVALDFGTSNSCCSISWIDPNKDGTPDVSFLGILPGELLAGGRGRLGDNVWFDGDIRYMEENQLANPTLWVTAFQDADETANRSTSIPSELISFGFSETAEEIMRKGEQLLKDVDLYNYAAVIDDMPKAPRDGVERPLVTPLWSIFPPWPKRLSKFREADYLPLVRKWLAISRQNFKWYSEHLGNAQRPLRAIYLEQLLVSAAASLRMAGIRSLSSFVATYPGAFREDDKRHYKDDLSNILSYVGARTGVVFDDTAFCSETISALRECERGDSEAVITVDMGGGTTDVGIILPGYCANETWLDEYLTNTFKRKNLFSYMASIRYAGNNLLGALCHSADLQKMLKAEPGERRMVELLKLFARQGSPVLKNQQLGHVATAFFEGLFEYVFNILSAILHSGKLDEHTDIKVILFGNGFKLFDLFTTEKESLQKLMEDCLRTFADQGLIPEEFIKRIHLVNEVSSSVDGKLSLAQGALKFFSKTKNELSRQYDAIEEAGHARLPIMLPGLKMGNSSASQVGLLSAEVEYAQDQIKVGKSNISAAFPVTWKHMEKTGVKAKFIRDIPDDSWINLARYYLEGYHITGDGNHPNFGTTVLAEIAKDVHAPPPSRAANY